MLQAQYQTLWNKHFSFLNKYGINMPSWNEYIIREQKRNQYLKNFGPNCLIKYILIGEAAPESGNYIYRDALGSYITSPIQSTGLSTRNLLQVDRLKKFASNGFLLIDLFPFSLDYSKKLKDKSLRYAISENNILLNDFILLLKNEISSLQYLSPNWDFCLVAPLNTSLGIFNFLQKNSAGFLMPGKPITHSKDCLNAPDFIDKRGYKHKNYTLSSSGEIVSKITRITVNVGGTGPSSKLVERVFF